MPSHKEILASLRLNSLRDIGPARFHELIQRFGSAANACEFGPTGWRGTRLFDTDIINRLSALWLTSATTATADAASAEKNNIGVLLAHHGPYPTKLREIPSAPPVLFVKGRSFQFDGPSVAMVGSRRSSFYAERIARWMAEDVARNGVTLVSGLAIGIDTCVHESALKVGGATWAVLGSGLGFVYPPENRKLADRIVENGALISEFPFYARPHPSSFPRRNRIISGLTGGTVVIEGGEKSGSLITARLAADQGRDVMAVPGPVRTPGSAAPHLLIKAGARLVETPEDILEALGVPVLLTGSRVGHRDLKLEGDLGSVLAQLSDDPISRDELAGRLQKSASELSAVLLELELRGLVRCLSSGGIVKT